MPANSEPEDFTGYSTQHIHALIAAVTDKRDEALASVAVTALACEQVIDQLLDELNRRNT